MNCLDFQELISAKQDKELTQEEEKILSEHLKTCANCAGFAKRLEELKTTLKAWEDVQIPPELETEILNRTVRTIRKERSIFSFMKGYYRVPRSLAWVSILLLFMFLINSFFNPIRTITEISKIERGVQEESKFQRIVLTEKDVVGTYVIFGKKN